MLFEALAYIVYIGERYYFSLVCTFKKVAKNVEGKVDVRKGGLGFKESIDNRCATPTQFTFSSIVVM